MLDVAWYVFSQTGDVESYLLFKELTNNDVEKSNEVEGELAEFDQTIL